MARCPIPRVSAFSSAGRINRRRIRFQSRPSLANSVEIGMWKSEQGYTVIELLIAVSILSVLSAQAYNAFLSSSQRLVLQNKIVEMQTDARTAMDFMVRELRLV